MGVKTAAIPEGVGAGVAPPEEPEPERGGRGEAERRLDARV